MRKNKSNYIKMQGLGDWLEKFLNNPITSWHIKELAKEAIALHEIDYEILDKGKDAKTNNSYLFIIIERMLELLPNIEAEKKEEFKNKIWKDDKILEWPVSLEKHDEGKKAYDKLKENNLLNANILDIMNKYPNIPNSTIQEKFCYTWKTICELMFDALIQTKIDLSDILKTIYEAKKPLYIVLNSEKNKKIYQIMRRLKPSYGGLSEYPYFSEKGIKTTKKFTNRYKEGAFPWHVIFSRTLFDFLMLGGWEYFGFCKRCEKFFIIQRKGRKKYCSDICRTLANKKD